VQLQFNISPDNAFVSAGRHASRYGRLAPLRRLLGSAQRSNFAILVCAPKRYQTAGSRAVTNRP